MGIRSLKTASISTGVKRSKVWDQTAALSLFVDYLVVAGGGGAGGDVGGGAGAGGLRSTVNATGGGGSLETPLNLALNTSYVLLVVLVVLVAVEVT